MLKRYTLGLALLAAASGAVAQTPTPDADTKVRVLDSVVVQSTRLPQYVARTPLAISTLGRVRLQRAQPQLSVKDALDPIPGVFALNPDNFAQDLRVSIRGFGARSNFGIRGVRVLVDGLPESTPDGQAQVDNIDLGLMERIEVVRGPASGLYGNASGGVINFYTEDPTGQPYAEARATFGSYGLQRYQLKAAARSGRTGYVLYGARTSVDGYRDHSTVRNALVNGKVFYDLDTNSRVTLLVNYANSPEAQDPGGINAEALAEDRTQARDRNLLFNTGEEIEQGRVGVVWDQQLAPGHQLQAKAYHLFRFFNARIPVPSSGIIDLNRQFSGGGVNYRFEAPTEGALGYRLQVGTDVEYQSDDRQRFNNLRDTSGAFLLARGAQVLDQNESFFNASGYAVNELSYALTGGHTFTLTAGGRFDAIRIAADDRLLSDGDDFGDRTYNRFNPLAGLVYSYTDAVNVYGNFSTSFETPTLNEFGRADGLGGFNPTLEPQQARNYEVGVRGRLLGAYRLGSPLDSWRYEVAAFHIDVENELIQFGSDAREFFRNAGASRRQGIEVGLSGEIASGLLFLANYSFSDFTFEDFVDEDGNDFGGKRIPGLPQHMGYAELRYTAPFGLYAIVQFRHVGELFAENANDVPVDSYSLLNWRVGYTFSRADLEVEPFFGLNNLLDQEYVGNVRINAFGGRYFEAAPPLNAFGGVRVRFR